MTGLRRPGGKCAKMVTRNWLRLGTSRLKPITEYTNSNKENINIVLNAHFPDYKMFNKDKAGITLEEWKRIDKLIKFVS